MQVIDYPVARSIILDRTERLASESRALSTARNCFLAEEVRAPFPVPRFDHSAVDGYAIRASDIASANETQPLSLTVTGTIRTGDPARASVSPGNAVKLFTGAKLPSGADAVIMVEDVEYQDGVIRVSAPLKSGKNVRRVGEEFAEGSVCLPMATRLTPAAIGLAATLGVERVQVFGRPRITLVITGSELVEPGVPLRDAQIYDANRFALTAALAELGIHEVTIRNCADDQQAIRECLEQAARESDVVITSGGASVGDVDFVKPAICELGGNIYFDSLAIKPGKPTVFGEVASKPLFGLPGNPVSALVTYLIFVKPALLKMMGDQGKATQLYSATLSGTLSKRTPRTEFVRAKSSCSNGTEFVRPCVGQESHMLSGLAAADRLIVFDGEPRTLQNGSQVQILIVSWT